MVKRASRYQPDRGDLMWLDFNPQAGHEQAGRRPALVVSPLAYNARTGLALCCPVTSHIKGYPFEILVPDGLKVSGAVLSDHVKNLDWSATRGIHRAVATTRVGASY
ncbi:MAG TPA: endoribonuclease MazF [Burkholderiales bacterium]|nr:endoribonuclease MazF [Burkholderiales bacterium]